MKKRLSVVLLTLALIVTMMPLTALAGTDTEPDHDVWWNLVADGEDGKALLIGAKPEDVQLEEPIDQKYQFTADEQNAFEWGYWNERPPWLKEQGAFSRCRIVSVIHPVATSSWFDKGLKDDRNFTFSKIEGVENLDTQYVTTMNRMFGECDNLTSLDLSCFDTSRVDNMSNMFLSCKGLTSIDLSGFDTSNVTDMSSMFRGCDNLVSLDLTGFDVSVLGNTKAMFYNCGKLETIYISCNADWTTVTESEDMFWGCNQLKGGSGTGYDGVHKDAAYARADNGAGSPGYFTEKHKWEETASVPATPSKEGSRIYTCIFCRETKTEKTPKLSGKWVNTLSAAGSTVKLKAKKLKKKAQTVKAVTAYTVSGAQGAVAYKKVSVGSKKQNKKYSKKFVVNSNTGDIKVKKGTPKGTYKLKVKVSAAGDADYMSGETTVTVSIKIK